VTVLPEIPPEGLRIADLPTDLQEQVQESLRRASLHDHLGLTITEIGLGAAAMEMPLRASAFNGSGNLHGGAVATLVDVTSGVAATRGTTYDREQHTLVTADLHIRYLRTPRGEVVRSRATVVHAGRQLLVLECAVTDEEDRLLATADLSMMIVPRRTALQPE